MGKVYNHLETKLIHSGEPDPPFGGAISMPIFQSSTFSIKSWQHWKMLRQHSLPQAVWP